MKFNIIECKEADLQDLYDGSALTFEGTTLDDDNLEFLIRWFNLCNQHQPPQGFVTTQNKIVYYEENIRVFADGLDEPHFDGYRF